MFRKLVTICDHDIKVLVADATISFWVVDVRGGYLKRSTVPLWNLNIIYVSLYTKNWTLEFDNNMKLSNENPVIAYILPSCISF